MLKLVNLICSCLFFSWIGWSQNSSVNLITFDGTFVIGYVNEGAFLNFAGPSISLQKNQSKVLVGMLPSLRFKNDSGVTKNSFITPSLGIGITYQYQKLAVQIPCYYQAKTNTENGLWHVGIGIGYRVNFNSKNKQDDSKI